MKRYLIRYTFQFVPVLLIISLIVFGLVYVAGDPVQLMLPDSATPEEIASLRETLGLNRPFWMQYWTFLKNALSGDFGTSFRYHADAMSVVLERLPASLGLGMMAMLFALAISIPLGIWSALRRNTSVDLLITSVSVVFKAMPNFWLGLMLILVFSVTLRIFPVSGSGSIHHMILPAVALGGGTAAEITRLVRSNMLETLGQDYIRTARAKGLSEAVVIWRHALKNCLNPVITIITVQLPFLIGVNRPGFAGG